MINQKLLLTVVQWRKACADYFAIYFQARPTFINELLSYQKRVLLFLQQRLSRYFLIYNSENRVTYAKILKASFWLKGYILQFTTPNRWGRNGVWSGCWRCFWTHVKNLQGVAPRSPTEITFVSNHVVYSWFQLPIAVIHGLHTFTICVDVTSVYALLQGPSSPIAVMLGLPTFYRKGLQYVGLRLATGSRKPCCGNF